MKEKNLFLFQTFTLLFVTLALAAVADPDEVAPYDSDAGKRMSLKFCFHILS